MRKLHMLRNVKDVDKNGFHHLILSNYTIRSTSTILGLNLMDLVAGTRVTRYKGYWTGLLLAQRNYVRDAFLDISRKMQIHRRGDKLRYS